MDPPRAALPALPNGPKEWLCGIDGYGRCWLRVSELSATRSGPVRSTSVLQEWEKWILVGIVAGLLQVRLNPCPPAPPKHRWHQSSQCGALCAAPVRARRGVACWVSPTAPGRDSAGFRRELMCRCCGSNPSRRRKSARGHPTTLPRRHATTQLSSRSRVFPPSRPFLLAREAGLVGGPQGPPACRSCWRLPTFSSRTKPTAERGGWAHPSARWRGNVISARAATRCAVWSLSLQPVAECCAAAQRGSISDGAASCLPGKAK